MQYDIWIDPYRMRGFKSESDTITWNANKYVCFSFKLRYGCVNTPAETNGCDYFCLDVR